MDHSKKRDSKAKGKGTVDFNSEPKQKPKLNKEYKENKAKVGKPDQKPTGANKFQKQHSKSPYQNRDKKGSVPDQSNSQLRRQKAKVSDLKKKLGINYNKLIIKKKEGEKGVDKTQIV